jgi:GT2 family glycosyltransferase
VALKVMSCSYGGNSILVEELRPLVQELGMELVAIHEWDTANIKWEAGTWRQHLSQADIIIVPSNYEKQPAKSANRVTQGMALGKPVICSPLQAYLDVERDHPGCVLVATTQNEWREHLIRLRDDETLRKELGTKALIASKDYFIDAIGAKWVSALFSSDDKVDIVIPTYNNLRCLKLCIESIRACTNIPYKIFVVNNGPDESVHQYLSAQTDINYIRTGRMTFAQAVNRGIQAGTNKYVCIQNDDTIVSKGWMQELIRPIQENNKIGVVGPLSNCDIGWLNNYVMSIGGVDLLPGKNTFEQIEPIVSQIYDYRSSYSDRPSRDWVAFYCTLIPRDVINKVGILDEKFENSGEDVDLCYRIRRQGYQICQNYKSFCFHFGAVGRHILEAEGYDAYHAADQRTTLYLNEKYTKENVVIYSGPSWEKWDFRNVDQGGIGGSETWQVCLARELNKLGYRVKSFCDCPEPGLMDGEIEYLHWTQYNSYIDQNFIDYFISSRTTDPFKFPLRAGKTYVQIHDVWLLNERNQILLDKIGKFAVLSDWHRKFAGEYHGIPDDKFVRMANGLDFSRYDGIKVERNPYRMFYSSSADRGLDTLLYLFPFIRERVPQLELHIFYGFNTWQAAVKQRNNPDEIKRMEDIKKAMEQPGVFNHGRVGQKELAIEQMKSSLWAYPTDFEESFCITAVEAQRAGCPIIASNYAGLQTTVGDSAVLIGNGNKGESYSKEYREKFVAECIDMLANKEKWLHWSDRGFKNSEKYSWANVARMWQELFKK